MISIRAESARIASRVLLLTSHFHSYGYTDTIL